MIDSREFKLKHIFTASATNTLSHVHGRAHTQTRVSQEAIKTP